MGKALRRRVPPSIGAKLVRELLGPEPYVEEKRRRKDEIGVEPKLGLLGGEATAIGGEDQSGGRPWREVVAVVKLGDGKRGERFKGELDLRGHVGGRGIGGDGNGAGKKQRVGQKTDFRRRRTGPEKFKRRVAHAKKGKRGKPE